MEGDVPFGLVEGTFRAGRKGPHAPASSAFAMEVRRAPCKTPRTVCRDRDPSGFYAWLKNPLSKRAREDSLQTELIRKAWEDSDAVVSRIRTAAENENRGRPVNAGLVNPLR